MTRIQTLLRPALMFAMALSGTPIQAQEQDPEGAPRRSLADGILRQLVEVEGLRLPRFVSGLEPGTGEGPLVLMRLGQEGEPMLQELPRGYGDHGDGSAPVPVTAPVEVEEVGGAARRVEAPGLVRLRVLRVEGEGASAVWHLRADGEDRGSFGWRATAEGAADLSAFLGALRAQALGEESGSGSDAAAPTLELRLPEEQPARRALRLWDAARAAGFGRVLLPGRLGGPGPDTDMPQRVAGLAEEFGWETKRIGAQPICRGELLVMLQGEVSWGRVLDLYSCCARAGIWDIGFVGADGALRSKLPLPVPFDEALLR